MKRLCDFTLSLTLLILLSPLLVVIATLVEWDTHDSFLFRHRRVGRGGKLFRCYKFRTMKNIYYIQTEDKPINDPRVTNLGRFLRKTSLDELPQLLNVLKGEMSFVGPRPVTFLEAERFYQDKFSIVSSVRPGITGLWQVLGKNQLTWEERVTLDCIYVQHGGLVVDFGILLQTIRILLRPTNY